MAGLSLSLSVGLYSAAMAGGEVVDLTGSKLLIESTTDAILLEGDEQSGADVLLIEGVG
jgi:hypothetical protein